MKVLDLFAGIGGFSLAAHWMGWETVAFVECDKFCQKVLRKNFGQDIEIHDDITTFSGKPFRGRVDIVTGGFPCQPYSSAGARKGTEDERHLWPEMLRVIIEVQPRFIVGENVLGLVNWGGAWFSTKCNLTWSLRGSRSHRLFFRLVPSTLPISEIGFGLLPTPSKADGHQGNKTFLRADELWETASCLTAFAMGHTLGLKGRDSRPTGKWILKPQFVEKMMGFPVGWTELEH